MQVDYKCNVCRHVQTLNEMNVEKCDTYDSDGNKLRMIYFICEKCGEGIVLQLDNNETIVMFDEERKMYINNMRYKLAHKTPPQKQKRKMEKLSKKLMSKRKDLFIKYSGCVFYDKKSNKYAKVYEAEEKQ